MAYTKATLSLISQTLEGGQKWWSYTTSDSIATVLAAGYISNANDMRMLPGDVVYVFSGTLNASGLTEGAEAFPFTVGLEGALSGTPAYGELVVSSVTSGAATLSPASRETIVLPVQDLDLAATGNTFKIGMPSAFVLVSTLFRTAKVGAGTGAALTLQPQISGVATTGGLMSLTLANQATVGGAVAGTAITGANIGAAGSTLEVNTTFTTAFTGGDGWVEFLVATLGNG